MIEGQQDLLEQTRAYEFDTVLDIGLGRGEASEFFLQGGKTVCATGFAVDSYGLPSGLLDKIELHENVSVDNMPCFGDEQFDAVWCAHVIEHVPNTGLALKEIWRVLKPGGYLFVMVPPYKSDLVGGHITTGWNLNTLMYNLLLNGFEIKNGSFIRYGYNNAAFVPKGVFDLPELRHDEGDIETLAEFFPIPVKQGTPNERTSINWQWQSPPRIPEPSGLRRITSGLRRRLLRRYGLE